MDLKEVTKRLNEICENFLGENLSCILNLNIKFAKNISSFSSNEQQYLANKLFLTLPIYLGRITSASYKSLGIVEFLSLYYRYILGDTGKIDWTTLTPLAPSDYLNESDLISYKKIGENALSKLAVLKLNGGLGTTMGCVGPKSAINIIGNDNFLTFIHKQLTYVKEKYLQDIPLILMNSFNTNEETLEILKREKIEAICFNQQRFPKIDTQSGLPVVLKDKNKEWNPPGHGDVYFSLLSNGIIDQLLSMNKEYLFISNSDNLGATVDANIFGFMLKENKHFVAEVTEKTDMDIKGGTFVKVDDRIKLLERAQVEKEYLKKFENTSIFPVFNTNNLWIHLPTLKEMLTKDVFELPLIVNPKEIEGRSVHQLESAMGAAIGQFENSAVVCVSRNRFLPVKSTADLLVLQSDAIKKSDNGYFELNTHASLVGYPKINLSDNYSSVDDYKQHVKIVPSLKNVTSLHIKGDYTFNTFEELSGDVVK